MISDISRQVLALDRSPKRVNVYEVMTKPAVYVDPEMDIRYCSRLFARFDLVRALVVDNKQILVPSAPICWCWMGYFSGWNSTDENRVMVRHRFQLNISAETFLHYYRGAARAVIVQPKMGALSNCRPKTFDPLLPPVAFPDALSWFWIAKAS